MHSQLGLTVWPRGLAFSLSRLLTRGVPMGLIRSCQRAGPHARQRGHFVEGTSAKDAPGSLGPQLPSTQASSADAPAWGSPLRQDTRYIHFPWCPRSPVQALDKYWISLQQLRERYILKLQNLFYE